MRTLILAAASLLSFPFAVAAQSQATRVAPSKGWLNDLGKARALAGKNGKPLMVVFRCDP